MPQLIEVEFKGNRREFFYWPFEDAPAEKTAVIVDADRGEDFGRVRATGDLAKQRKDGTAHGQAQTEKPRPALRAATADEINRAVQLRADEDNVRKHAIEKVRAQKLDMKVSDTEWQWDKKKLTIYFTAEQRVDFRSLVRQLEGQFGTRVQMWHIGVRDEAKRLDGIGRCARQYCSASWLPELRPVKSSVAKDQRLSTLNPAQISGTCGRLMCCLRYEHEFYVQQRKRFPKEGKVVTTVAGEEKVVYNDIFREMVSLRAMGGDVRIVPLAVLKQELGDSLVPQPARQGRRAPEVEREIERDVEHEAEREIETEDEVVETVVATAARVADMPFVPGVVESHTADDDADDEAEIEETAPETPSAENAPKGDGQRRRRRRGRRGGRRGRDGTPPTGGAPQGSPPPTGG